MISLRTRPERKPRRKHNPQGGNIVYGVVGGATTQAEAMGKVLRVVHNNCGEKPQVGKVFKVRGTNSDAVFFTVVNHPQGNKQVAGMVIATASGPNRMEAALVFDDAARFGSTVNPMLTQALQRVASRGRGASFRIRNRRRIGPAGARYTRSWPPTIRPAWAFPTGGPLKALGHHDCQRPKFRSGRTRLYPLGSRS